ncbi:MAG: class I SAM-dependent methyltransferase [Candidatus Competibacteraceae bacterium]|nr:class I SAM-dependent methyltransferase [Candidatus Competibacteraceae bacterium]
MKVKIKKWYQFLSNRYQTAFLDYPVHPVPRLLPGNHAFEKLNDLISKNDKKYQLFLSQTLQYKEQFWEIQPAEKIQQNDIQPVWNNGFLPGLDMIALYGMLAQHQPQTYLEVGSGNSTLLARKAINDQQLSTKLISIDPFPRRNIEGVADEIIRQPLENINVQQHILQRLQANDILFIDNSHRSFSNSDVTVFFLEILPFLRSGVIVHIHDIYLPYDYPQVMCDRLYNEQYLLASTIISNQQCFETIFPGYYVFMNPSMNELIAPVWNHPNLENVEKHGGSFWVQVL